MCTVLELDDDDRKRWVEDRWLLNLGRGSWVVEPNLIALMEFWTFIDDNPKFQALWLNRSRELDELLETYYSTQDIKHYKQLLNNMNESRELQLGRHQGKTKDKDRLKDISNEMAKLSGEMDTRYTRQIEKEITDLYNYMGVYIVPPPKKKQKG